MGYGLSSSIELGVYLPIYTVTRDKKFLFDGTEIRALIVMPHTEESLFSYGVNISLDYNSRFFDVHPLTVELRPILDAEFGQWRVIFNPIVEIEFSSLSGARFAPAQRIDYRITQRWSVALEEYSDLGRFAGFDQPAKQQHTLFIVGDYTNGPLSLEAGIGAGLTGASNDLSFKLIISHDLPHAHLVHAKISVYYSCGCE